MPIVVDEEIEAAADGVVMEQEQATAASNPYAYHDADDIEAAADSVEQGKASQPEAYGVLDFVVSQGKQASTSYKVGEQSIKRGLRALDAANGYAKYEDIAGELKGYKESTEARQEAKWEEGTAWYTLDRWIPRAAGSLPYMIEGVKGAAAGGATQAAIGAGIAFVAGQAGPQVAVPEEVASIPVMSTIMGSRGATIGSMVTLSRIYAGNQYADLREKGVSHQSAFYGAAVGGAVQGWLDTLQLKGLGKAGQDALVQELRSEVGKKAFKEFLFEYAKDFGVETGEQVVQEGLQKAAEDITNSLAEQIDLGHTDLNPEKIIGDVVNEMLYAIGPSAGMVTTAKEGGRFAGKSIKLTKELMDEAKLQDIIYESKLARAGYQLANTVGAKLVQGKMTIQDVMAMFKEGLKAAKPDPELIDKLRGPNGQQVLDELLGHQDPVDVITKPGIDEDGKVIQSEEGLTFKLSAEENVQKDDGGQGDAGEVVSQGEGQTNQQGKTAETAQTGEAVQGPNTELPSPELKARRTRIDEDIKSVETKIEEAEQEMAEREEAGKPTVAIQNKIAKLYNAYESLDTEKNLIDEGYLTEEDVKSAKGTIKIEQLNQLRAKAVQKILSGFEKGIRTGTVLTKRSVRQVQTALSNWITKETGLSPAERGAFLNSVKNIRTEEQLKKALPDLQERVETIKENSARKSELSRTKNLMRQGKPKKAGKYKAGKFTAPIQRVLDVYREMIGDTTADGRLDQIDKDIAQAEQDLQQRMRDGKKDKSATAKLDALYQAREKLANPTKESSNARAKAIEEAQQARAAGKPLTDEQLLREAAALEVGDIKSKTAEELRQLNDSIEALMKWGRAHSLDAKLARAEKRNTEYQEAIASIQGNKPVNVQPENAPESRWNFGNRGKRWIRTFFDGLSNWDKLMAIVSQHDTTFAKSTKSVLMKLMNPHESLRNEYAQRAEWTRKAHEILLTALGINDKGFIRSALSGGAKKALLKKLNQDSRIEEQGVYVNQSGETVPLVVSVAQARKIYMEMQSPDLRAGLEKGNGYTFEDTHGENSTEHLVNSLLTEQDKQLIQGQFQFYNEFFQTINKWWRDKYGMDLSFIDFYSPAKRRVNAQTNEMEERSFFETVAEMSMKPTSAIERTKNAYGLELQNDVRAMLQHMADWTHYMNWSEWNDTVQNIFYDVNIGNVIKTKYGAGVLSNIRDLHLQMTNKKADLNKLQFKWFDDLRHKAATAYVGGKLLQIPKQLTAILGFLEYQSPAEFTYGLVHLLTHPVQAIKVMESSPMLKERGVTMDRDLKEALKADTFRSLRLNQSLSELFMTPVLFGDRLSVWGGGWGVYLKTLKKTGSEAEAMKAFEEAFDNTQQSGNLTQLSTFQTANSLSKIASLFLSYPIQQAQKEIMVLRNLKNNPSLFTAKQAAKIILLYHVTIPALFQAVVSGIPTFGLFGEDDEDEDMEKFAKLFRAVTLGPFNGLPLTGDVLNAMGTMATNVLFDNKEKVWKPDYLPNRVMTDGIDAAGKLYKFSQDPDLETFFDVLHKASKAAPLLPKSLGGGLPLPVAEQFLNDLFVDPEANNKDNKSGGSAPASI